MSRTFWDMYDEYEASLAVDELSEPISNERFRAEIRASAAWRRLGNLAADNALVAEEAAESEDMYDEYREQRPDTSWARQWNINNRIERV